MNQKKIIEQLQQSISGQSCTKLAKQDHKEELKRISFSVRSPTRNSNTGMSTNVIEQNRKLFARAKYRIKRMIMATC